MRATSGIPVLLSAMLLSFAEPSFADPSAPNYKAQAWGTYAAVGTTVIAGATAVSGLGCRAEAGAHFENSIASVDLGNLLAVGAVNTMVDALSDPTAAQTVAAVKGLSLLGGVVTADVVKARSTTSHDETGFHVSAQGSRMVNLRVAGIPIVAFPSPNTRIDILGVGHVILNEQIPDIDEDSATFSVNMIHLVVTVPGPNFETEIIVAHAKSGLQLRAGPLGGLAYISSVELGDVVESGPSALVNMPCAGTNGELLTNSVDELLVPPVLVIGQGLTTARGTVTTTVARGKTSAGVHAISLLGGLITADLVKAVASVQTDGTTVTLDDEGSRFVNLRIDGIPFGDAVGPNTHVDIAGVGTLWLRRTVQSANTIEVTMIELDVLGGVHVRIAVAIASVE